MDVDIKAEPSSPPPMLLLVSGGMTDVHIKAEPSSPPPMLPFVSDGMTSIDIKVEPSSPPPTPSFGVAGVHIKEEPSSPPPSFIVPPVLDDTSNERPADEALGINSSESSRGSMDSSVGTPEGAQESSPRKPEGSVDSLCQCRSCGLCFSREEYLKSHQNQCQAKLACSVCSKRFASMRTLVLHQRVHSGNKPHACQVCGCQFATRASMVRHELIHTGERPYACEVCPSRFTKKESLDKHKELHVSGVDVFHCASCGAAFSKMTLLQKHLRWHEMEKPHACHLCPARFTNRKSLQNHVLKHTCERPYVCPVCERGFCWRSAYYAHVRKVHGGVKALAANTDSGIKTTMPSDHLTTGPRVLDGTDNQGPADAELGSNSSESSRDIMDSTIGASEDATESSPKKPEEIVGSSQRCSKCRRYFAREKFHEHWKSCNGRHVCSFCGKTYSYKQSLVLHLQVHAGEERHACLICGRRFTTKRSLTRHQLGHTGEKPYACDMCPSKFTTRKSLDNHKRLHEAGVEMFHCSECGIALRKMSLLQKHLRWHKMEKPHPCHLCPARFTNLKTLKNHVLQHTCEKPHVCPVCESRFAWHRTLIRHMRQLHSGVKATVAIADTGVLEDSDNEGPADAANSPGTSRDVVDSSLGIIEGAAGTSAGKPEGSVSSGNGRGAQAGGKRHTCTVCGRTFTRAAYLATHKSMHAGERPYSCDMCPSKFYTKQGCNRHKRVHASGVDLCNCPKCGKAFKLVEKMKQHLKSHTVEKPYSCHICSLKFRMKFAMENHVLLHTVQKPHTCPVCKRVFAWRSNLGKHIHREHAEVQARWWRLTAALR